MADTLITFRGKGVKSKNPMSFTVFQATNGADKSIMRSQIIGQATSTSPEQLHLPESMIVEDVIAEAASGKLRLESNGLLTQTVVDMSAQQGTSAGRPTQNWVLGGSKTYRFIAEGTLPA